MFHKITVNARKQKSINVIENQAINKFPLSDSLGISRDVADLGANSG